MKQEPDESDPRGESTLAERIEGMRVEFDERVTLFPVDLEEMRDLVPRAGQRRIQGAGRSRLN